MAGKGVWSRIPGVKSEAASAISLWQQVNNQLIDFATLDTPPRLNIWQSLASKPAGLWQQLGDETMVPGATGSETSSTLEGLWDEALEETLILDRSDRGSQLGPRSLWRELDDEPFLVPGNLEDRPGSLELWQEIGDETIMISRPEENVWEKARGSHGFADMVPKRLPGYAVKKFATAQGEEYYILKNLRQGSYLRLIDRQYFLWEQMDGENAIQDIAVAYMTKYGSLDVSVLIELLGKLSTGGFLASLQTNVYSQLNQSIASRHGISYYLIYFVKTFLQREFPLPHMDIFYTRAYNAGIKYFYTKPALVIMFTLAIVGSGAFLYLLATQRYSVIHGATSNVGVGVVLLYVANMLALFIHEGGHAFTCKSYGRTIRKSGIMIYYGFFAFYVDSTDIWMEKRLPRIMVSFGGPFTGFVLGGAASLFAIFSPWTLFNGWLYQFAFLIIVDSIMNLNPLLKWDGYYILMDWLEIPNLRTRALKFLKDLMPVKKLLRREKFDREERIFTIYGVSTLGYTASILFGFILFFGESIVGFIARYIPPWIVGVVLLIAVLFLTRNKIFRFFGRLAKPFRRLASHSGG